jgi:hypothetical protein
LPNRLKVEECYDESVDFRPIPHMQNYYLFLCSM